MWKTKHPKEDGHEEGKCDSSTDRACSAIATIADCFLLFVVFCFRVQDEISMWEGGMPLAFLLQDTVEEGGSIKQANSESHDAHKSEPLQEKTWFFSLELCVRLLQKKYC